MSVLLVLPCLAAAIAGALALHALRAARRVEAALPPAGRFVDVPGARLHVLERGQGPAVLLVHGLAGQLGHFTYGVVDALAARYRMVAVDRPGSGYSLRAPGSSAALGVQADALAVLIERLQLGRPLVVGHSLGGAVALALAQRHPQRVAGLALLAPLTHPVPGIPPILQSLMSRLRWLLPLLAWTLAMPLLRSQRAARLRLVFSPDLVPPDYDIRGGGRLALRPGQFIGAAADLAALPAELPGLVPRYGGMHLPVRILYGRSDRVLDPQAQGAALATALPDARLTWIDGGHMLPITAWQRTAQFIDETMQEIAGARASSSAPSEESTTRTMNHRESVKIASIPAATAQPASR